MLKVNDCCAEFDAFKKSFETRLSVKNKTINYFVSKYNFMYAEK